MFEAQRAHPIIIFKKIENSAVSMYVTIRDNWKLFTL